MQLWSLAETKAKSPNHNTHVGEPDASRPAHSKDRDHVESTQLWTPSKRPNFLYIGHQEQHFENIT